MTGQLKVHYKSREEQGGLFTKDRSTLSCLSGPGRSGKTTDGLMKIIAYIFGAAAVGAPVDRHVRAAVLGVDAAHVWSCLLPIWFNWVPRDLGEFRAHASSPSHSLQLQTAAGRTEVDVDFIIAPSLDKLLGREWTCAFIDNADWHENGDVAYAMFARVGRPADAGAGALWVTRDVPGPISDLAEDNWLRCMFDRPPSGPSTAEFLTPS